jgi:hypothetical protein
MSKTGLLLGVFVVYWVGERLYWWTYERLKPFTYRDVVPEDIGEHFAHFYRRAFRGSEMIVTEQSTDTGYRLRKWYAGSRKLKLDLIAECLTARDPRAAAALAVMRREGIRASYGKASGTRKYSKNVVCHCDDPELAAKALGLLVREVMDGPADYRCSIWVRGQIAFDDRVIHGKMRFAEATPNFMALARPYKNWHRPHGLLYWVGRVVGAVLREIHDLLFGPRGPGDDLRR